MLKLPAATMHNMGRAKVSRGRAGNLERGGIRKRGASRLDHDGDLVMDRGSNGTRGGKRARGDLGRNAVAVSAQGRDQRRTAVDGRTLNVIQKALSNNTGSQVNVRQTAVKGGALKQASIRGWKQSKVASHFDGGIHSLISFLEKKMTPPNSKFAANMRIDKSKFRVEGDALIVSLRPELIDRLLQLNGTSFSGASLTIEADRRPEIEDGATTDTKTKMTAFLSKRYYQQTKVLDLSNLGTDPDLVSMGLFNNTSTESKFFPALMRVWEMNFDSPERSRDAVRSVSLSNNQLNNISAVTCLSQAFPNLKDLDLSNNSFRDAQSLSGWRWKFRHLEFLDLSGSPFSTDPSFKDTMLKWYPKLKTLNNTEVRTAEELAARRKSPISVQPAYFQDDSRIAENFVRAFFFSYDSDRNDLINGVYDSDSTFSLNVNTSALRAPQESNPGWDQYIKRSRNILRINHLPSRMSREYTGAEKIREAWNSFPRTKHPDITTHPEDWLIECHPMPGLPDPTGHCETGVGGLVIMVHGKFDEIGGSKVETRSFDRTFVLGPGGGVGGLRVVNDMLTLRAYGGHDAWDPNIQSTLPFSAPSQGLHPQAPEGYGILTSGKTDAQVQRELMILQISFRTKMTLEYSEMALSGNGWNTEAALRNFEELKAQGGLPQDAFLPGA